MAFAGKMRLARGLKRSVGARGAASFASARRFSHSSSAGARGRKRARRARLPGWGPPVRCDSL